jgi:multicomponent Na+:H+ antiporter subunit D
MSRIWSRVFWGEADPAVEARLATSSGRMPVLMTASTVVLVLLGLAIMVFAGPLYELAERTATQLLDPSQYVEAVLGGRS